MWESKESQVQDSVLGMSCSQITNEIPAIISNMSTLSWPFHVLTSEGDQEEFF